MAHRLRERKRALQADRSIDTLSVRGPRPASISASSSAFTDAFSAGRSRNQGKKATHHRTPRRPAAQNARRQEAAPASAASPGTEARALRKPGASNALNIPPKRSGEKAPPQRSRSQRRPPQRARTATGSHSD